MAGAALSLLASLRLKHPIVGARRRVLPAPPLDEVVGGEHLRSPAAVDGELPVARVRLKGRKPVVDAVAIGREDVGQGHAGVPARNIGEHDGRVGGAAVLTIDQDGVGPRSKVADTVHHHIRRERPGVEIGACRSGCEGNAAIVASTGRLNNGGVQPVPIRFSDREALRG